MVLKKEGKEIKSVNKGQSSTQYKKVEEIEKNECGCGCLANKKK